MIKMIKRYIFLLFILNFVPVVGIGQTYPIYKNTSSIAVLDQDSLFTKSEWGRNILNEVESRVSILSKENRSIEKELEKEELKLTELRKIKSKVEFDILAFEFDTKVKEIRDLQSNKQMQINNFLNDNRKLFFEKITPFLLLFIDELGVEVLLNKDTVALASLGSDITEAAIVIINRNLKIN